MPRQDGRIEPGQKLTSAISARAWNRAQQAADIVLGSVPGSTAEPATQVSAPYTWVYAKNVTSSTVPRWGVTAITGVEITPTGDMAATATRQFETMPVLAIDAITEPGQRCVAIEPIAAGSVGRVAVAGVVQVKTEDADKISTTVLWKNETWAFVRLGGDLRWGTVSEKWFKNTTADITPINSDGTPIDGADTFQAINLLRTVDPSDRTSTESNVKVVCAYSGNRWLLVNAEWEPVRIGQITTTWPKGSYANVTKIYATPSSSIAGDVFEAFNYFSTITVPESSVVWVACARVDDQWVLVSAECG